jgi:hypothetical protein
MRCVGFVLACVGFAAVAGCAHVPTPLATALTASNAPRAMTSSAPGQDPLEHAKAIVTRKFSDEHTTVESVDVVETELPAVYTFVCNYRRAEFDQMCEYQAKGQVDVVTEKTASHHRVRFCLGPGSH